jgi:3-oxoacyl-[acyl-carrier protein] reductase
MGNGVCLSLQNKVAIVTGGSRGIGAATVKMFTSAGARVGFNYLTAKAKADELVKECGTDECIAVQADFHDLRASKRLVDATVQRFGRLDILVANHGIWPPEDLPINEMTDEHWLRTVDTNLNSIFALIKHSVAQMKRQKSEQGAAGHIVLVSSTAGQRGEAFHCDYAATKGALISMVKGLSTELARDRIYVNCVAPGWVDTDMAKPALNDPQISKLVLATIPLGRVGTPEEIAAPILFLCTEHSGFVTGEIFNVNGGAVLVG